MRCRVCRTELTTAAQRKVGRCDECPAGYDEATYERLRAWRSLVARAAKVPTYVVFTDATLTAIAENEPADATGLLRISGVGERKAARYGPGALAVLAGADPTAEALRWCEEHGVAPPDPAEA